MSVDVIYIILLLWDTTKLDNEPVKLFYNNVTNCVVLYIPFVSVINYAGPSFTIILILL